jgi:phosphate transport system substrate-binding protein
MSTPNTSTTGTTSTSTTSDTDKLSTPTQRKRGGTLAIGVAIAIAVILLIVGLAGGYFVGAALTKSSSTSKPSLTEQGSSLLYPIMTQWAGNYSGATISAGFAGSGTGQSDAELGLVNIGASDAYIVNATQTNLVTVPVAISSQLIYYNIPGVTQHLNLNGTVLAMIFNGSITSWVNPLILDAQVSGVQTELKALSSPTISPIVRADSSGDSFLFSSYCYMSWSGWGFYYGTKVLEHDPYATGYTANSGVVTGIMTTPNSIGYVGISYEATANADGLHYAALGDNLANSALGGLNASNYILPSTQNISEDADLALQELNFAKYELAISLILGGPANGAVNLTSGGGGTNPTTAYPTPYPDANLEYTLIKAAPVGNVVTSTNLAATVAFLQWVITYGNWQTAGIWSVWITSVGFLPLTPEVAGYDQQMLATVHP